MNFSSSIFQWCFSGIYPPIIPIVTQPIATPKDSSKYIYVVFVEESSDGPHFLNDRKGCYVRVDEYSQRIKPRKATLPEIEFLQNRRRLALQLRDSLFDRAQRRFDINVAKAPSSPYFSFCVTPKFPGSLTYDSKLIGNFVTNTRKMAARGSNAVIQSQPDGFFFSNPGVNKSYFEIDVYGLIYYAEEFRWSRDFSVSQEIQVAQIFALVIFYLAYARDFYKEIGYDGTLLITIQLNNISGIKCILPFSQQKATARLDNNITIVKECPSISFREDLTSQVVSLYRKFCFDCGHAGAFNAENSIIHSVWLKPCLDELRWTSLD